MPTIRAIISDLDDTLLNEHHQMSPRTEETLRRIQRQGVKVILASGRSAASMRPTVRQIQATAPYIAYNGAQIVDPATDKVLLSNELPLDLARQALEWLEARSVHAHYYAGDDWFYAKRNAISDEYGQGVGIEGTEVGRLSAHIRQDTPKILAIDTPERIAALMAEAKQDFGDRLMITMSKPHFMEITLPAATKGNAVRRLAEMIGLTPDTTICAGDSLNDLSMLQWSALPVAVSNAHEQVKRVAWRIVGDGHRDGVAILLDELIEEV